MDLGARLRAELGADAFAVALAVLPEARGDVGALVDSLVIAGDAHREMPERVAALALASLLAHGGVADVDAILDDDLLIDGALAHGAAPALTALALAAGDRASAGALGYLAVRLAAGGATGANVAALHARIGDAERAAHAFAAALLDAGRRGAERSVLAVTEVLVRAADRTPALIAPLANALDTRVAHTCATAARALGVAADHPLVAALSSR